MNQYETEIGTIRIEDDIATLDGTHQINLNSALYYIGLANGLVRSSADGRVDLTPVRVFLACEGGRC
jgi:hypothetical protein